MSKAKPKKAKALRVEDLTAPMAGDESLGGNRATKQLFHAVAIHNALASTSPDSQLGGEGE